MDLQIIRILLEWDHHYILIKEVFLYQLKAFHMEEEEQPNLHNNNNRKLLSIMVKIIMSLIKMELKIFNNIKIQIVRIFKIATH